MNIFSWKISGPAGLGIRVAGNILGKSFFKKGYEVFVYNEFPSRIQGGHSSCVVDISDSSVNSSSKLQSLIVALDENAFEMQKKYLSEDCIFLCDEDFRNLIVEGKNLIFVPFSEIAKEIKLPLARNSVALGSSLALMGFAKSFCNKILRDSYRKQVPEEVNKNILALNQGYDYALNNYPEQIKKISKKTKNIEIKTKSKKLFISGNEASALGAVAGKCKYFSAYPMSPSTSIFHYLHAKQKNTGMVVHQSEDEIAAIFSCLGSSFAGVRSMTATSGGGFCLMTEAVSMAGMAEIGTVIINAMRPGPGTGLPTWTEQGDLNLAVYGGHGDFPRAVLAPGDPAEAYVLTQEAFNIAELYQIPVILLTDKFLGDSQYTQKLNDFKSVKSFNEKIVKKVGNKPFKRYLNTKDGISARTIPGEKGGMFFCNSDEHNEYGYSVEGFSEDRKIQVEKRARKLETLKNNIPLPKLLGPKNADLTLVGWGSSKGPAYDSVIKFNKNNKKSSGWKINYLHFSYIFPLPEKKITKILKSHKRLLILEDNNTAQFNKLLRSLTGIEIKDVITKYDGRPFFANEINKKVISVLKK